MSLLFTLEHLLGAGVYPRDRWWEDEEEEDDGGGDGGEGGDDDDDSGDDDSGDDDEDQGDQDVDPGGGDFDWGDGGDSGDDDDDDSSDFDYGDQGDDSGWVAVEDYEENGRTIRKFTDNTGTDYFQDVGEWSPRSARERSSSDDGFDWSDASQRDDWMRGESQDDDLDPDIRDLHDYYHPYTVSKYDDDPVRKGWGDGIASDGTRFDQQDEATRNMFGSSFGEDAPRSWAEQRSRDLEAEYRQRGVVTLPQQQAPSAIDRALGPSMFGQEPQSIPEAPAPANALGLGAIGAVPAPTTAIPPYTPPAVEAPPPTPPAEATTPQPQSAAPPPSPVAPTAGQQAAADAAARATAQAGGSPQQVADAAAAAALAYDRRNLSSESPETQRQFEQAYGDRANERWVQQHNQELGLNRALYGTAEPRAGTRQTGAIPGLGDVGPAPDRTIGRAEAAPWTRPATAAAVSPGAQGLERSSDLLTIEDRTGEEGPQRIARADWDALPGSTQARWNVTNAVGIAAAAQAETDAMRARTSSLTAPPPPPTTGALSPSAVSAVTSTTRGLIGDILQRPTPGEPGGPPLAPGPVLPSPALPEPNRPVRGPTMVPPPLTAEQAAAYERGGVNPATGDIAVQDTVVGPGGEQPEDILTIRNGNGQIIQEPRWSWDQRGPQGQQVWEVVNAEGAPTQSMVEAGFERTSAVSPIDASIRQAANVPVYDDNMGPREAPRVGALRDPFGMLIQRAAEMQGATDVEGFGRSVASGIVAREAWTEPYVNDLARTAWYRESRGLEGGPQNAPASYIEDWKGAFRSGDMSVLGVAEVSDELRSRGVPTPSDLARAAEVKQVVMDWRTNVARLNQNTGASYRNPANAAQMALYACGAASFATAVNAVNPDANLRVDDAMTIINRGGRNLINPSVGLTLGSDLSAMAPAFNEAGVAAEARNFTPQTVQQHFEAGGGPIVFSGPGWGRAMGVPSVPAHIYTATNADANGVTIVDSSGSNLTRMTWNQWQGATGGPARGAGISAVPKTTPSPGAAPATAPTPMAASVAPPPGGTENAAPSPQANLKPTFTVPETQQMRSRILNEMPDIQFEPNDDIETRMRKMAPALEWLEREYGMSAEAMAGMAYNESGIGTAANAPAGRANNLWSVEYLPTDSQSTGPIPQGRWAAYPSVKHAVARFVGMYAHPENGYRHTWQSRRNPDALLDGLVKDKYIVDEPGHPISNWYKGVNRGREIYRKVRGR